MGREEKGNNVGRLGQEGKEDEGRWEGEKGRALRLVPHSPRGISGREGSIFFLHFILKCWIRRPIRQANREGKWQNNHQ